MTVARISVLVVDDSVVIRRLVTALLDEDPEITVVGTVRCAAGCCFCGCS